MALIQTVHLSMANFKSAPVVPAVQNDTDRQVKMIIDDYTLTSGVTGKIAFERSDGTHYETAAELVLADNAFTADIDQALTQPGRTMVQLKVTDTLTVSSFSFVIFVEADNSGTVTPQEGIDLVTAVEAAEDAADRAEEAAAEAGGLSDQAKQALLACFANVAWIGGDGQDYYDALEDALYPVTPVTLVSISAVYTQIGTVYDTDSLDSLKADLVVTGHYDDSTTAVIPTGYTLSGTLTAGTSTITVSYQSKTTTFNVTVSEAVPLYPLENGTHTFSTNNRVLTVSNGDHFEYEAPNATASTVPLGSYLNLSKVSENDDSATTGSNINKTNTLFTIPNGSTAIFEIKNISFTNMASASEQNVYALACRSNTTSVISTGDKGITETSDITVTKTFTEDTNITCIFAFLRNPFAAFQADISLTVDGVRWI